MRLGHSEEAGSRASTLPAAGAHGVLMWRCEEGPAALACN